MSPILGYETLSDSRLEAETPTRVLPADQGDRTYLASRRRVIALPPRPSWYENIPTWVSISLFLHGLILLLIVVLIGSPETFGLANKERADRATNAVASTTGLAGRVTALERVTALQGTAQAPQQGADPAQRLDLLESRVARLCAAVTPPC